MESSNFFESIPNWIVAITAIGALVVSIISFRYTYMKGKKKKKGLNLFFSIQMKDLTKEEYSRIQISVNEMIENIKSMKRINDVYYFNSQLKTHEDLIEEQFPINEYMTKLEDCDYFIAVISKRVHSSIYFEAGFALSQKKECIYFVKKDSGKLLPIIMDRSSEIYDNSKIIQFTEIDQVIYKFREILPKL